MWRDVHSDGRTGGTNCLVIHKPELTSNYVSTAWDRVRPPRAFTLAAYLKGFWFDEVLQVQLHARPSRIARRPSRAPVAVRARL